MDPFGASGWMETFDPYADYTAATLAADYGEPCDPVGSNVNCPCAY
jgi:hypothetical protein